MDAARDDGERRQQRRDGRQGRVVGKQQVSDAGHSWVTGECSREALRTRKTVERLGGRGTKMFEARSERCPPWRESVVVCEVF